MEKKVIEKITEKKEKDKNEDVNKTPNKKSYAKSSKKLTTVKIDQRNPLRKRSTKKDITNSKNKNNDEIPLRRRSQQVSDNLLQSIGLLKKKFKCIKTYSNAHQDFIERLVVLKNGKIASCSYDSLIKLWDVSDMSKKPSLILKGHTNTVTDIIQYTNTLLASVSKDKTIRKWNVNTGKEVYCYSFNTPFLCICPVTDTTVCCGGGDQTLRIYDLSIDKQIEELYQLNGHSDIILCLLQMNSSKSPIAKRIGFSTLCFSLLSK
jgi:WD40 repeat protein